MAEAENAIIQPKGLIKVQYHLNRSTTGASFDGNFQVFCFHTVYVDLLFFRVRPGQAQCPARFPG
jgi:hypothetical protein